MNAREAFQFGFLVRCAEEGLTAPQAAARCQAALQTGRHLTKQADGLNPLDLLKMPLDAVRSGASAVSSLAPLANTAVLAGVGLPILAGGGLGYGLAQLTDDDTDVDRAKTDEVVSEYRRLTDHLQRQRQLRAQKARGLQLGSEIHI